MSVSTRSLIRAILREDPRNAILLAELLRPPPGLLAESE